MVAFPIPLPNVIVNNPVRELIVPVSEFVGLPGNFARALLLLTATLKSNGTDKFPPETSRLPDVKSIAAVWADGVVQGENCADTLLVNPAG